MATRNGSFLGRYVELILKPVTSAIDFQILFEENTGRILLLIAMNSVQVIT